MYALIDMSFNNRIFSFSFQKDKFVKFCKENPKQCPFKNILAKMKNNSFMAKKDNMISWEYNLPKDDQFDYKNALIRLLTKYRSMNKLSTYSVSTTTIPTIKSTLKTVKGVKYSMQNIRTTQKTITSIKTTKTKLKISGWNVPKDFDLTKIKNKNIFRQL